MLFIAQTPGLNCSEGKAVALAAFIFKGQFANSADALGDGGAFGHIDGGEDSHFDVFSWIFHKQPRPWGLFLNKSACLLCCCSEGSILILVYTTKSRLSPHRPRPLETYLESFDEVFLFQYETEMFKQIRQDAASLRWRWSPRTA